MAELLKIRAKVKKTGHQELLEFTSVSEAAKCNPGCEDFTVVGKV